LLGTDETPHNPDNSPKDVFERDAVEALISGQNYYEKIEKLVVNTIYDQLPV